MSNACNQQVQVQLLMRHGHFAVSSLGSLLVQPHVSPPPCTWAQGISLEPMVLNLETIIQGEVVLKGLT